MTNSAGIYKISKVCPECGTRAFYLCKDAEDGSEKKGIQGCEHFKKVVVDFRDTKKEDSAVFFFEDANGKEKTLIDSIDNLEGEEFMREMEYLDKTLQKMT